MLFNSVTTRVKKFSWDITFVIFNDIFKDLWYFEFMKISEKKKKYIYIFKNLSDFTSFFMEVIEWEILKYFRLHLKNSR